MAVEVGRKGWFTQRVGFTLLLSAALFSVLSCSSRPPEQVFGMGDRAQVGRFVFTVLEAQWSDRLGEGATARLPSDRFLLLRLSVTNGSNRIFYMPQLTLTAAGGREYEELTEVEGLPDWWGVLRRVNPSETETHWIVFDVPRADYRLRVMDDEIDPADRKTALIDIPIRLATNPQGVSPTVLK
ncbi:MAG: DUF4352 domain-containing protein [Bryobacteraceae bacterium]|nr:DUF4352 domain-containing protein [Bryobacteraceae bacterium]